MKKVLVVEDNENLRKLFEIIFIGENFDLIYTDNSVEAIKMAQNELPDIIISEMKLPEFNGLEMAMRIKSQESTASSQIILLLSEEETEDIGNISASGVDSFLIKPFTPIKLLTKIELALKEKDTLQ